MYNISYTAPSEIKGHIRFKKDPCYYGVGNYEDDKGNIWNIVGIYGRAFVQAILYCSNMPYFSTAGSFDYSMCWEPYTYEVEKCLV